MARTDRCPDCYSPLHAEHSTDCPEVWFVFCTSPTCNPMLIANLNPGVEVKDEEWIEK